MEISTYLKKAQRLGRQGRGIRIRCCRCSKPEKRRRLVGVAGASLDVGSDAFVRCQDEQKSTGQSACISGNFKAITRRLKEK